MNEEKEKNNPEKKKCLNCGKTLSQDEEFCTKCGMRYGEVKKAICTNCGCSVEFGKKYCGKCGTKLDIKTNEKIDYIKNNFTKKNILKRILIVIIVVIMFIGLFSIIKEVYKKVNISIDELLIQEKYEEAYKKAKKEEKEQVITKMIEKGLFKEAYKLENDKRTITINELSYYCKDIVNSLKDPSSFSLREIYWDKSEKKIVFIVNANNSYGASVKGYWYYTYDSKEEKYTLYTSVSSLEQEKIYEYADDSSEKIEKILKNRARKEMETITSSEKNKIKTSYIDCINELFKKTSLKDVEYPDYATINSTKKAI